MPTRKKTDEKCGEPEAVIKKHLSDLRRGEAVPDLGLLMVAPIVQSMDSGAVTFFSLGEWLGLPWPEVDADDPEIEAREEAIRLGTYIAWYAQYVNVINAMRRTGQSIIVRRFSGRRVGKVLLETVLPPPPAVTGVVASIAPLVLFPGSSEIICVACSLHTREGLILGGAVGWNAGVTDFNATWRALEKWAGRYGAEEIYAVSWGEEDGEPVYCVLDVDAGDVALPVADPAEIRRPAPKRGVVVPFPAKKREKPRP
ncbi:MAG: hypothetical protein XD69_0049 [Clostridia bacterium 62_21]|nr:MAG: hypothetical protein XD69_0049 [Clostridia bacterium 62_21]HAG07405.1 hypothetical protein [Peptococcaceae bacterium]